MNDLHERDHAIFTVTIETMFKTEVEGILILPKSVAIPVSLRPKLLVQIQQLLVLKEMDLTDNKGKQP